MVDRYCVLSVVLVLSGALACAGVGKKSAAPAPASEGPAIEMVFVKGGCFRMGTTFDTGGPEEKPAHEVCVGDFHIGKYEVTQGQWRSVMGNDPSSFRDCGEGCPVETVSWNDVQAFIARLNGQSGGGGTYRLPTEAEWEYAARSGGKNEKFSGPSDDVGSVGWYLMNQPESGPAPHPVGLKAPNGLGIHDMTGNVWEWTSDWYGVDYYSRSPRENPTGPDSGDRRVVRGGGFANEAPDVRASYRNYLPPDYRGDSKGFRLVRTAPAQPR